MSQPVASSWGWAPGVGKLESWPTPTQKIRLSPALAGRVLSHPLASKQREEALQVSNCLAGLLFVV